jgi:BCD family chlorophyll transporter-like MFS transporter
VRHASVTHSGDWHLGWLGIFRIGLVQMAIGAIVVLTTSTLNRVMVVELALPAMLPGALVGLYYGVQLSRPNWGYRSDAGGKRTPWIIGGMAVLALGGLGATLGTVLLETARVPGLALSILSFLLIGVGVGASGTSLLALLATATAPERRAAAATITWLMMILGIALTAGSVGALLDPYSPLRLLAIVAGVCAAALLVTTLAMYGLENRLGALPAPEAERVPFRIAFAEIWGESRARNFSIFIFLSMTAYFMQELIIEPFSGHVFLFTPGQSTSMAGLQNGGVFLGMLLVGIAASGFRIGSLRLWAVLGCTGSAAALVSIAFAGVSGPATPLLPLVFALGFFNGVFAVSAIGSMMQLAGEGRSGREGTRMGLWGAAQAIAAGFGGFFGAAAVDAMRAVVASPAEAYGAVFVFEALLFLFAAFLALRVVGCRAPAQAIPGE